LDKWFFVVVFFIFLSVKGQTPNMNKADNLYLMGNYAAAINAYSKIGDETANLQIARAYNAMGNYAKAIIQYRALLEGNPKANIARFELGKLLLKTKRYNLALGHFECLMEQNGDNPEYAYYVGRTFEEMGKPSKALQPFRDAVNKDSTHLRSLFSLGKFYVGEQQKDSSLKYINRALRLYKKDVSIINLKALAYFNDGQYGEAIPLFEELLELGEEKAFIHKKLGFSYFREWEYGKAREHYHKLANNPERLAQAYYGLAEVFLREQKLDSAEYYIQKSIAERKPNFSLEYADLGCIARLQGRTKKAMDYYYKAWEEYKENPLFYHQFCTLADEYYRDPNVKLKYYQRYLDLFGSKTPFLSERVEKRITELKEEIHFSKD